MVLYVISITHKEVSNLGAEKRMLPPTLRQMHVGGAWYKVTTSYNLIGELGQTNKCPVKGGFPRSCGPITDV